MYGKRKPITKPKTQLKIMAKFYGQFLEDELDVTGDTLASTNDKFPTRASVGRVLTRRMFLNRFKNTPFELQPNSFGGLKPALRNRLNAVE